MATTTSTDINDLYGEVINELVEAGFNSLADSACDDLTTTQRSVVDYFQNGRFDAYRLETDGFTFCRFSDEGIDLMTATPSGVIRSEAHLTMSAQGVAWMGKMVAQ